MLLVDECQDTDPIQVELIKALCGKTIRTASCSSSATTSNRSTAFAAPTRASFDGLQAETPNQGRLPLSRNFRSQPAILALCQRAVLPGSLTLATLVPTRRPRTDVVTNRSQSYVGPAIEFMWCLPEADRRRSSDGTERRRSNGDRDDNARNAAPPRGRLDRAADLPTAGRSRLTARPALRDSRKVIRRSPRPVRKGDIAILFRSLSDVAYYEEALRSYGIDYYLVGGHAFYAQQEIFDVLNLLRTLASPADEVRLAGVLRSPFFSLPDETLFWLSDKHMACGAGLTAKSPPQQLDAETRERVIFAAEVLAATCGRSKDRVPIADLLNAALARTGYDAALLAEFLGERKLANLRKLIEQARAFDRGGVLGLSGFHRAAFAVCGPRAPRALGRDASRGHRRGATDDDSPGQGAGVSRGLCPRSRAARQ